MIVEITKPSKGERREHQKACLGSFLQRSPSNIVSNNLSNAPKEKKSHSTNEKPQVTLEGYSVNLAAKKIISQGQNATHGNKYHKPK